MARVGNRLLLDADILINWLAKETDPATAAPLWEAPYKLLELIEAGTVEGMIALTTLLEIRFVLRRKKGVSHDTIERMIEELLRIIEVYIPDEISLLKANQLQAQYPLDPFDAILLAGCLATQPAGLIARDKSLLAICAKVAPEASVAMSPEEFLVK